MTLRLAAAMALCLLVAGPAFAAGAAPPAPIGWLDVEDAGCVAHDEESATTHWEGEDRAVHSLTIWLSLQETIRSGPVEIEVDTSEKRIAAWIPIEPVTFGDKSQVPTCIRPLTLQLRVGPLEKMDYAWHLRRGTRAQDEPAYRRALEAARAGADTPTPAQASPAEAGDR